MKLTEFQSIMLIDNVPSVLKLGILSFAEASRIQHSSVALQEMQDIRDGKSVTGGLPLHEYANVYFHARNPMMSKRRDEAHRLCVLRVSMRILEISGAVITDQNATSKYVRFNAPDKLDLLDLEVIFARNWKHPEDKIKEWKHSSAKCAEVLIPKRIPPEMIEGAYVCNGAARQSLVQAEFCLPITIDADLFFH
ncbi:MAG: DUF4433 domain-containing protein [Chthoniobacteraceae bacterium]|jgi:hypothetical protein